MTSAIRCVMCGKGFVPRRRDHRKFCGRDCQQKFPRACANYVRDRLESGKIHIDEIRAYERADQRVAGRL